LEQSQVGVKIEENLGYGLTAIDQIETGFVPTSGGLWLQEHTLAE